MTLKLEVVPIGPITVKKAEVELLRCKLILRRIAIRNRPSARDKRRDPLVAT